MSGWRRTRAGWTTTTPMSRLTSPWATSFPQTPEGHHASIAFDSNTKLMYYRQDKFDEAGITSVPKTWEETIEVCRGPARS